MKTKTCPMCKGEQFFTNTFVPMENLLVAALKMVGVYASVCLSCGFVAPTLDDVGLSLIREKAGMQEDAIAGEPGQPERGEL